MTGILNALIAGVSGAVKDAYFNLVSLLLPGNGTNGAQNNTFLDGSSNNFTITRNGNTTQGTFSPFSQTGWGAYFDGSNDYVSVANQTALQLSGSQFTIEGWFYFTTSGVDNYIVIQSAGLNDPDVNWLVRVTSANKLRILLMTSGSTAVFLDGSTTVTANSWHYFAATCDGTGAGSNVRTWLDGVYQGGTTVNTANINTNSAATQIGGWSFGSSYASGYISNLRILKGTALYTGTSNIAVPLTPLTAETNTSLLTCQSNRFKDNSSNGFTVTPNNGAAITPFSPFAPTQSYSASAVGGSGYFDGTGDYLSAADNTALNIGTSDFQIGVWVYPTAFAAGGNANILFSKGTNNIVFIFNSSGTLSVGQYGVASRVTASSNLTLNQWSYVVASRVSNTTKIFLNGTEVGSASDTSNYTSSNSAAIGQDILSSSQIFTGYMTDFRLVKGSGVTSVTVPTAPLTAITNTSLLLNFTNAGVVDATAKNVLETVGNAQISTTQSKWGGSSINFASASNSYLLGNTPSNWTYLHDGSSWTIEFWLYPTDVSSYQGLIATNAAGSSNIGQGIAINAGTITLSFTRGVSGSSASFTSSAVLNANQWNYVGITFTSSTKTCAFFINGASAGSSSNTGFAYSSSTSTYPPYIGQTGAPGFPYYFNGYIDDLRITRGVARTITANPTAPFPLQ